MMLTCLLEELAKS